MRRARAYAASWPVPDRTLQENRRKSRYTADRGMPAPSRARPSPAAALMTGGAQAAGGIAAAAFALPALGFALGPMFEDADRRHVAGRRARRRTSTPRPTCQGDQHRRRASARPARRRSTCARATPSATRPASETTRPALRGDLHPLRPPGLPGPLRPGLPRFICPCHGGVYDFQGEVAGGPPVRPLDRFYTRVEQRPRAGRPALLA